MKIDNMNKYQVTESIKKAKEIITNPNTDLFDVDTEIINEIMNPPVDKDGYTHKYYLPG